MKTFVIIKPDAIQRGLIGRIISRFEDAGFEIINMATRIQDVAWFNEMYGHLHCRAWSNMKDFMVDTLLIGIILEGHDAVSRVRRMVGATDSTTALTGTAVLVNEPVEFVSIDTESAKIQTVGEIIHGETTIVMVGAPAINVGEFASSNVVGAYSI